MKTQRTGERRSADNAASVSKAVCSLVPWTILAVVMWYLTNLSGHAQGGAKTALSFDGVNDAVIRTNVVGLPTGNPPHTIEAWVKIHQLPGVYRYWLLLLGNPGPGAHHWLIGEYGATQFGPWSGIGQVSPALPVGVWFHLATTFDGSILRVYVNGTPAGSTPSSFNLQGLPLTLAQGHAYELYFSGLFDEVRLWNVARTGEQILEYMNRRVTGAENDLVLYYRFDEGTGAVANDVSGHGNMGLIVGNPAWVTSGAQIGRPFVTTALPTDISATSAELRGVVDPNELPTGAWFEWGTTSSFGHQTVLMDLGNAALEQEISEFLTNLLPNTSYRFRAMASNSVAQIAGLEESFVTGTGNRALDFDGVDDYLLTPDLLPAMTNETLTLEFWFKPDAPGMLVSERVAAMGWYESHMEVHPDGQVLAHVNSVPTISLGRVSFGTWNHVVLRYDKASLTLDGFLNGTPSLDRAAGDWWASFEFGAVSVGWGFRLFLSHGFTAEPGGRAFFNGQLDDIRIWNTARTEEQIQVGMNGPLTGSEPGLIAYYRCDEGSGSVVLDATSRALHAGLSNNTAWVASDTLRHPLCITGSASEITTNSARVRGVIYPEGRGTAAWLEWGTTTNYGNVANFHDVGNSTNPVVVSVVLTDLLSDTVYYYRWVATNVSDQLVGRDSQFQTAGQPESTSLAANLSGNTAKLNGSVIPNGQPAAAWFEWGTTSNYGNATAVMNLGDSFLATNITEILTGLAPEQTYHFRVVASNASGVVNGTNLTFRIPWLESIGPDDYQGPVLPIDTSMTAWGDYDADGDLDLVLNGLMWYGRGKIPLVRLYANTSGSFTNTNALTALTNAYAGALAWGDYDNDGDLDLLITGLQGWSSGAVADICRNDHGVFSALGAGLPALQHSAAAWGDYDNDGDLDLLLAGQDVNSNLLTRIYRNDRSSFTDIDAGLPGILAGAAVWCDWDGDGDLDILLSGSTNGTASGRFTALFRNDRTGFSQINTELPPLWRSSASFGDYDADGDLDLLLSGSDGTTNLCRVYRNDGVAFSDLGVRLPCNAGSQVAWVDFDNDGDLDIHVPGHIYRNDPGAFVEQDLVAAPAGGEPWANGYPSAPAWGDYDGDGDLDVLISWRESTSAFYLPNVFYRNNAIARNTPPAAPPGLCSASAGTGVTLQWEAASDAQTPSPCLTYNVRVGTTPGGTEVVSPHADLRTGQRLLPQAGNAEHRLFATLTNLAVGTYYWSVQAVDTAFGASPFAAESSFVVTNGPPVVATLAASDPLCCSATLRGLVIAGGLEAAAWFEWGLDTNYGSATPAQLFQSGVMPLVFTSLLAGLQPRTLYHYRAVATNLQGMVYGTNQTFLSEVPIPLVSTLAASNVAHTQATLLGTVDRANSPTTIFFEWGTTTDYGQTVTSVVSSALEFDGENDRVNIGPGRFPTVTNTFTIEVWARPSSWRDPTPESTVGYWGDWAQRHAIFPDKGEVAYGSRDHAGVGLSVGTNGVTVFEYAYNDGYSRRFNSPLVYTQALAGWTHLAVVYTNQQPWLYLNGILVRTGLTSPMIVHPSANLGGTDEPLGYHQGFYPGALDKVRVWSTPLSAATIQEWMNRELTTNHPAYNHLQGYWPLNEGSGTTTADVSPNGNTAQLINGPAWIEGWPFGDRHFCANLNDLLPGATYHFRAVAVNPGGTALGQDQAFTTLAHPSVLGLTLQPDRSCQLSFSGVPGKDYTLEASTNLVYWMSITNLVAGPDGLFDFLDSTATNCPTRFYRLKVP